MTSTTPNHTKYYKLRCISFPARPSAQVHQDTITLSKHLENLKSCLPSLSQAHTLCNGLVAINHLYNVLIKNLLINSPQTLQSLSNPQYKNWVADMIDQSMIYVDMCGKTRDAVCEMSECTCELQSALRRKKGNAIHIESNVEGYIRLRKNMKKGMEKSLLELKKIENKFGYIFVNKVTNDKVLYEVVRVLNEVSLITNVMFQKLLLFLSASIVKPKTSKWTSLAKRMTKGGADNNVEKCIKNEFVDADIEVMNLGINGEMEVFEDDSSIDSTLEKLEGLDMRLRAFEHGLETLFKNLIYMRVTYLNICSQ